MSIPTNYSLEGKMFGRLLACWPAGRKGNTVWWMCICVCGVSKVVRGHSLTIGDTRSCGCLRVEIPTKHGHCPRTSQTPEYVTWRGMRSRCNNPKSKAYRYYGARGIKICTRWNRFGKFLLDMGSRPKGKTLDRINNDGDYEPGNCRWATNDEQRKNKRPQAKHHVKKASV